MKFVTIIGCEALNNDLTFEGGAMLTDENFDQIRDYVLQELPRVLEQEPQFVIELEKVIREEFEGQEEFAGLLETLTEACEIVRQ